MKTENRNVKIVCTLGPATSSLEMITAISDAGMNVARLNFSHGTYESHKATVDKVRLVENAADKPIAVLLDTKGPEIRTGTLAGGGKVTLGDGTKFVLRFDGSDGDESGVSIDYPSLYKEVAVGQRIFIDDGTIELSVSAMSQTEIACSVVTGGELGEHKGINVPGADLSVPTLTAKDISDIKWGIENDVDYIAVSFVRTKDDIMEVRRVLEQYSGDAKVIAKIETKQSVDNIDGIITVADGLMVARGDLGVEIPTEDVPMVQKSIIEKCRLQGKPVIVATQMLDSMIRNPRPTRAEASDVANAVIDGTDAVMLSGETAGGLHPVEAVTVMNKIIQRTEKDINLWQRHKDTLTDSNIIADSVSHAARDIAASMNAAAVVSLTSSGGTARMVSKYRPGCRIIAATPQRKTWRQLALVWGVLPIFSILSPDLESSVQTALNVIQGESLVNVGDNVVITSGVPLGSPGSTNTVYVHTVGQVLARGHSLVRRVVTGKVCKASSPEEALNKALDGNILVLRESSRDYIHAIERAMAVVTEESGLTSFAGVMTLNLGLASVFGAAGIFDAVEDGMLITVDGIRGLVYKGRVG